MRTLRHIFGSRFFSGHFSSSYKISRRLHSKVNDTPLSDVLIPETSLILQFLESAVKFKNNIALVNSYNGQTLSYSGLIDVVRSVASGLNKIGVRQGDVVAIASPNCVEYCVSMLAIWFVGGVVSTFNPLYSAEETAHALQQVQPKIICTISPLLPAIKEAIKTQARAPKIIMLDNSSMAGTVNYSSLASFGNVLDDPPDLDPKSTVACIPFSSGTTGLFKGVMLSHYNIMANLYQIDHPHALCPHDSESFACFLPLFHIYGMVVIFLNGLLNGARTVTIDKFDPANYLRILSEYQITTAHIVPPVALFMARSPMLKNYDISSVYRTICGAAPLSSDVIDQFLDNTGIGQFREGYGMTELSPVSHFTPSFKHKVGSVGVLLSNQQCKVIDTQSGETLPHDQDGELCVRGPNVMMGYLNNEKATREMIDSDGFLHTGDVARYDKDGFYYIVDRVKELIKYKGYQVAPAELEHLLLSHPFVSDVAVVGIPDEEAGELPKAFVVKKPDTSVSSADLEKYVADRVSPMKKLRGGVQFIREIPKSASGKILRRQLKNK